MLVYFDAVSIFARPIAIFTAVYPVVVVQIVRAQEIVHYLGW